MGCNLRGLFTAATVLILLENGCGFSLSGFSKASNQHLRREKRCSCNNLRDKECIYFCHKDIIWINTPGKTTPYGLGSPATRRKRSTPRCECANSKDGMCSQFCQLDRSRGSSVQQKIGVAALQYQNSPQHQTISSSTKQRHRTGSAHLVWILRQITLSKKALLKEENQVTLKRNELYRERRR